MMTPELKDYAFILTDTPTTLGELIHYWRHKKHFVYLGRFPSWYIICKKCTLKNFKIRINLENE